MATPVDVSGEDVQVRNIERRIHDAGLDQGDHPVQVVHGQRFLSGNNDAAVADMIESKLVQGAGDRYKINVTRGPDATIDADGKEPIAAKVGAPTAERIEPDRLMEGEKFPGVVVGQVNKGDDTARVPSHEHGVQQERIDADEQLEGQPMPGVVVPSTMLPGAETPKAPSAPSPAAPDVHGKAAGSAVAASAVAKGSKTSRA